MILAYIFLRLSTAMTTMLASCKASILNILFAPEQQEYTHAPSWFGDHRPNLARLHEQKFSPPCRRFDNADVGILCFSPPEELGVTSRWGDLAEKLLHPDAAEDSDDWHNVAEEKPE